MGRVRTKTVKKSAKVIIERYYPKLTLDFETNKRICDEIAIIASKRLRNKVSTCRISLEEASWRAHRVRTPSLTRNCSYRLPATPPT
jgi:small subunit ribosomal protein S17e